MGEVGFEPTNLSERFYRPARLATSLFPRAINKYIYYQENLYLSSTFINFSQKIRVREFHHAANQQLRHLNQQI